MTTKKIKLSKIDVKSLGRRIREIRGFDLTQVRFAGILGIRQTTLSKYEQGLAEPPLDILVRLRDYSGKSIDWIVTGESNEERKS